MGKIADFLSVEHRRCDAWLAETEGWVTRGEWERAGERLETLTDGLERHFAQEEEVLFPEVERATGSQTGPTQVMRSEHQQMRQLLGRLRDASGCRDADAYLGLSETLLVLMDQHNAKEEGVLYPLADRLLGHAGAELVERMAIL